MDMIRTLILKFFKPQFVAAQAKKPSGLFGTQMMLSLFNQGNHALNLFMHRVLAPSQGENILEIGFGSGKWLPLLVKQVAPGKVVGVDFSPDLIKRAIRKFKSLVQTGQLEFRHASLSQLPFPDRSFHKICTANTLYFWPEPVKDMLELKRVLKPGGKLVIGFRTKEQMDKLPLTQYGFTKYTEQQAIELAKQAGFQQVEVMSQEESEGMVSYCLIGYK